MLNPVSYSSPTLRLKYLTATWGPGSFVGIHWKRRLEDNECTYDELDSFFDCAWITRIWTWQEIILSPNPIVVCGNDHISWERLGYSVMFLANIHVYSPSRRYHGLPRSSSLSPWVDTFSARGLYRASHPASTAKYESEILNYWKFCHLIQTNNVAVVLMSWVWGLRATLVLVITSFTPSSLLMPLLIGVALGLCSIQSGVFNDPRYFWRLRGAPAKIERHVRSSLQEKMLEILSSRNSTEPRDMSFGLHSVLQRLPGHISLPVVSQNISLPNVYLQLTEFLLHNSKSLQVLTLATRHRCQGAASWVPDYSKIGGAEPIDAGSDFNTSYKDADRLAKTVLRNEVDMLSICEAVCGTKLPFRYHRDNDKILVKGITIGRVSVVTRASVVGQHSRIGTVLYEGYAFDNCMIGDTLVLIAGFHRVLVVRKEENCVKIVGAASLKRKTKSISSFRHDVWRTNHYIEYGRTWRAHEKKRKENWKREHGWTDSDAEPHPSTYLQDILIS